VSCTIRDRLNPRYKQVVHLGSLAGILNRPDLFACAMRQLCLDEQPNLAERSHKDEYMVFLPDVSVRYFSTQTRHMSFLLMTPPAMVATVAAWVTKSAAKSQKQHLLRPLHCSLQSPSLVTKTPGW
jgi:hypothetical protein